MTRSTLVVLVQGPWSSGQIWDCVKARLIASGHAALTLNLRQSDNTISTVENFERFVSVVRVAVTFEITQGHNVIVVMHGPSAIPACNALAGIKENENTADALGWGKILKLVFLASPLPPINQPLWWYDIAIIDHPGSNFKNGFNFAIDAPMHFFNGCDQEDAERFARLIKHHSSASFTSTLTYAAWEHFPSHYLVTLIDKVIDVIPQMYYAQKVSGRITQIVSGHFPQVSHPDEVAKFILEEELIGP